MTDAGAARLREDYLARLDDAIRALPHGVAMEIRDGVAEELSALDERAVAARIAQLGDPTDIAREAQAEVPGAATAVPPAPVSAPAAPATSTSGFAIAAALTLGFGGIVVPVVGWVVGAVLVCLGRLWKAWEKAVAILVPLGTVAIAWLVDAAMTFSAGSVGGSSSGAGVPEEPVNPLVPDPLSLGGVHLFLILAFLLVVPASGLWLLWRLRGRVRG